MIEAVAWALGITGVTASIGGTAVGIVKVIWGKKYCDVHPELMTMATSFKGFSEKLTVTISDIATIKQRMVDLAVHFAGDVPENLKLRDEIIKAMLKRDDKI